MGASNAPPESRYRSDRRLEAIEGMETNYLGRVHCKAKLRFVVQGNAIFDPSSKVRLIACKQFLCDNKYNLISSLRFNLSQPNLRKKAD